MGKNRIKTAIIISSFLVTCFCVNFTAYAVPDVSDEKITERENLDQQYSENEENILNLETEIQKIDNDLSILTLEIEDTKKAIEETESRLETENENLEDAEELMDNRIREMYKNNSTSVDILGFIVKADSLNDLITRVDFAKRLANTDKKNIDNITKLKEDIELDKKTQEELKENQLEREKELDSKKEESKAKMQELIEIRSKTESSIKDTESSMVEPLIALSNSSESIEELNGIAVSLESLKNIIKTPEILNKITSSISEIKTKAKNLTSQGEEPIKTSNAVVLEAYKYLGIPYLWGGDNPKTGMDCSGFTSYVYRQLGYEITRTTYTQVNVGQEVEVSLDKLEPGDLIFFGDKEAPHHVAIYIGNNLYIHAPQTGDVIKISQGALRACTARRIIGDKSLMKKQYNNYKNK